MNTTVDPNLSHEVAQFGARDMALCMQCGTGSASCPLSSGSNPFPRKIYRYLQLGLRDKLLASVEPWLCYYCGDCNRDCPRGAEPAETMMATRRWLTAQYDWTGLARRFYLSAVWELGALVAVALGILGLFAGFHGPMVTERVSVNTFAPVLWIEVGDLTLAVLLTSLLLSNAYGMYRHVMADAVVPLRLYVVEAKAFVLHFLTQMRWRECGEDRSRWLKHFLLVTGYLTMMMLVIVFIRWFQVDDSSWHFTSLFGYYATGVLLFVTVEMLLGRLKRQEAIHRYSELSDWLFLGLLFLTAVTGLVVHLFRLAGWPVATYVAYAIHLAIAVPMLIVEVPFGKWSHIFYRPLAVYLATVKQKATVPSVVRAEQVQAMAGGLFWSCMECGTCTSLCPQSLVSSTSPRLMLRDLTSRSASVEAVDRAVWSCVTCNACGVHCPRGIEMLDLVAAARGLTVAGGPLPARLEAPLASLRTDGNPWGGARRERASWATGLGAFTPDLEYCLFTCCTTAYDPAAGKTGRALPGLLRKAGVSFGTLGTEESCCGDPAHAVGAGDPFSELARANVELFGRRGVRRLVVTSPHCLDAFSKSYRGLGAGVHVEHYTEVLERLLATGRLVPTRRIARTVTFHDPCYLGRHHGIYDAPRRVLRSIPGLELLEMPRNRSESLCCGGGGGAWNDLPAERRLNVLRVREALDTGAETIVTACPFCVRFLGQAVGELGVGHRIGVLELSGLLAQSIEPAEAPGPVVPLEAPSARDPCCLSRLNASGSTSVTAASTSPSGCGSRRWRNTSRACPAWQSPVTTSSCAPIQARS